MSTWATTKAVNPRGRTSLLAAVRVRPTTINTLCARKEEVRLRLVCIAGSTPSLNVPHSTALTPTRTHLYNVHTHNINSHRIVCMLLQIPFISNNTLTGPGEDYNPKPNSIKSPIPYPLSLKVKITVHTIGSRRGLPLTTTPRCQTSLQTRRTRRTSGINPSPYPTGICKTSRGEDGQCHSFAFIYADRRALANTLSVYLMTSSRLLRYLIRDAAIDFLGRHGRNSAGDTTAAAPVAPWFLYLPFQNIHGPYTTDVDYWQMYMAANNTNGHTYTAGEVRLALAFHACFLCFLLFSFIYLFHLSLLCVCVLCIVCVWGGGGVSCRLVCVLALMYFRMYAKSFLSLSLSL